MTLAWQQESSPTEVPWWRREVIYQIYPRSFADSNGDGIGDLQGILDHLDHLEWLGVGGIWLCPITVSRNDDFGYDVADYCAVDPDYGDLDQLDTLIAEARRRGIAILLDLVPNHTSSRHPWFVDALQGRSADHRDWYVWADPASDGGPPNNWVSTFGGPAWAFDEASGQYYLHNFLPSQPDLNWWNPAVRSAFDDIVDFWEKRGISGFRIDVCNMIIKDAQLRDNPPAGPDDPFMYQAFGQQWRYNANRPEVHDVIRHWRTRADAAEPSTILLGETNVDTVDQLVPYYGNGSDELHMAFNFAFIWSPFEASILRSIVEDTENLLPRGAWPVWTGSNHDVSRLATRWADGDPSRIRAALVVLLTLRGTPVLYQGDEIGLVDGDLDREDLRDPIGIRSWPAFKGRDPERTPMPWEPTAGGGFTSPDAVPWLPVQSSEGGSVETQRLESGSTLHVVRNLIAMRRRRADLTTGDYLTLPAPADVWMYARGRQTVVVANLSDRPQRVSGVSGRVLLSSICDHDGMTVGQRHKLEPWEALVVDRTIS